MGLIHEIDYGTPASKAEKQVTLTVDGFTVTVPEGTSIMRASMEAGIQIPKLCATDMVDAFGSCRLCLVEIEGRNGTPSSCTTPVAPGMVVKTQTNRLKDIRRGVMELYISDHPLDCLTCAANGDCELQDMAGAVGLRDVRYGYDGDNHVFAKNRADGAENFRWMAKDESNPYFTYDPSKCIVCSRCVRACEEVQGTFALTIEGRGFDSRVSPGMHQLFLDSECVSCGACVQACPTATLTEKSVIQIGQPEHSVVTTAPIAASAARSRPRCAATNWCAWCRGRTARPIAAIPASRAASPMATPRTRSASSTRWSARRSPTRGAR